MYFIQQLFLAKNALSRTRERSKADFSIREREVKTRNPRQPGLRNRGNKPTKSSGFTLTELLVVILIILILSSLVIPAFNALKGSGSITQAAFDIGSTLEQARSFAMTKNTYVWVAFYEEDVSQGSKSPAVAGVGRVVISVVASKNGTSVYTGSTNSGAFISPAALSQLVKLVKIENAHLSTFAVGSGSGSSFDTRPAAGLSIGSTTPSASQSPIQYPLTVPSSAAQYTFVKAVQFSPRGEVRINDNSSPIQNTIEIGLQPTHGIAASNDNPVAIQVTGIGGSVKIFQR